jgi:hypothetical protein
MLVFKYVTNRDILRHVKTQKLNFNTHFLKNLLQNILLQRKEVNQIGAIPGKNEEGPVMVYTYISLLENK